MSGPDDPRWLEELGPELRGDVPVRPEWRARLLAEIAREPAPSAGERARDEATYTPAPRPLVAGEIRAVEDGRRPGRRHIVLSPFAGLAAAVTFAAIGAGAALVALSMRGRDTMTVEPLASDMLPGHPAAIRDAAQVADIADRELVRFELSAPAATQVALVGSFNRWNPVATPLVRDSVTGKWQVAVRLPPGRHVYAFVVDGAVTADPFAPRAADDDFGSPNSVVLVSGPAT